MAHAIVEWTDNLEGEADIRGLLELIAAAIASVDAAAFVPEVERLVGRTVEDVERALILQTLASCRGNRTCASTILGISVRTMRNKLKTFIDAGIPVAPAV